MQEHSNVIATAFALCGFAAAAVCGLLAENPANVVIFRALISMMLCYLVGSAGGYCIMHAVQEHLDDYVQRRPVPSVQPHGNQELNEQTTAS